MASKRISGFACSATRSAIFTLAVEIRSPNLRTTVGRDVCVSQGARRPGGGYRRSARQVAGLDPFGSITTRVPTPSLARYSITSEPALPASMMPTFWPRRTAWPRSGSAARPGRGICLMARNGSRSAGSRCSTPAESSRAGGRLSPSRSRSCPAGSRVTGRLRRATSPGAGRAGLGGQCGWRRAVVVADRAAPACPAPRWAVSNLVSSSRHIYSTTCPKMLWIYRRGADVQAAASAFQLNQSIMPGAYITTEAT